MSVRWFWCCLSLVFLAGCSLVRLESEKTAQKAGVVPSAEPYRCFFAADPLKMDGRLDEPAWAKAGVLKFILPETFQEPLSRSEGRLLYDQEYLYIGIKAYDQDIWATYAGRDDPVYREDVLEAFIKTDPDKDPYYEFEFSPLGAILDGQYPGYVYDDRFVSQVNRWLAWNCAGLKVGTQVKGTLQDWSDRDEYWTLEVAVPFAGLPTLSGKKPEKGDTWIFQLARYDYSIYLPKGKELSSCAFLSQPNFHLTQDYLKLIFDTDSPSNR